MDDALIDCFAVPPNKKAKVSPWFATKYTNTPYPNTPHHCCKLCDVPFSTSSSSSASTLSSEAANTTSTNTTAAAYFSGTYLSTHEGDPYHAKRVEQMLELQALACRKLKRANQVAVKLHAAHAPSSMKMPLALYLFNPTLSAPVGDKEEAILDKLELDVKRFQTNEPFTLLELAVWKAACILMTLPTSSSSSFYNDDPYRVVEWWNRGWKVNKTAARHDNMIDVVLTNVVPFLVIATTTTATTTTDTLNGGETQ